MSTNETDVVEIKTSAPRTLGLIGLSMLLTAFSAAIALDALPGEHIGIVNRAFGIAGVLFFGLGTAAWLWRHLRSRGTVLTLSREGIRDARIAPETIPWSAVRRFFTWEYSGQRILVLDVDPAVERTLHLSAIARWTRGANRKFGADGLCIATHGLKINYDELFELVRRHVLQAQAKGA
jgi:hypothetical protein